MFSYGIYDGECDFRVACPICLNVNADDYQHEDYIDYEMIWCDSCGARLITNIPYQYKNISIEEKFEMVNMNDVPKEFLGALGSDANQKYFRVRFMKIHKIMNWNLATYTHHSPTQELIQKFVMSELKDESLGFVKNDNDELDFSCGLVIDSYDAEDARKRYRLDTSHDGVYMYIQCVNDDGKLVNLRYWGD